MKKTILGLIFIFLTGTTGLAQDRKTDPNSVDEINSPSNNSKTNSNENVKNPLLKSGTNLDAELQSTLDVKKTRVGDEVVLKTTKTIKENGKVVVPKGAKLIGRVTEVQKQSKDNTVSKIGILFETIEGKNLSAPISASIISIANVGKNVSAGDVFESSSSANSNSMGNASSGNSTGGLLGGVTKTAGGVLNTATQTAGGLTNTTNQTVGGIAGAAGRSVKGLQINQSVNASANSSTVLSSQDRNLRIEKGANFQLQVQKTAEN